jgi:hypothetical protein
MCRSLVCLVTVSLAALAIANTAFAANPTKLSINCTPSDLSPGVAAACVVTVTDAGSVASRKPPTGTVTFTVEGTGTFDPEDGCLLEESGAFSSKCTVAYTPTAIAGGWHRLLGTYGGDDDHGRATAQFRLEVTPANDELDHAIRLPIPTKVTGTTDGATWNWEDDPELCSDAYGPVWYSLRPAQAGRIAVRLTVRGRVDSVVAVFRQNRSKLEDLGCALSDESGVAGVPFDAERGTTYLIAVAAPWDARVGGFTVETATVPPVNLTAGKHLGRDADVTLDPLLRPGAAFSVRLRQAVTYRIDASAPSACVHLSLERAGGAAGEVIGKSDGCSGYLVYTPGPDMTGPFALVVTMPEGRAAAVHVSLRTAEGDDLAPGVRLANGETRRGSLSARNADVVDVYQFEVDQPRDASLTLLGRIHADVLLLDSFGRRLACACDGSKIAALAHRLSAGSYFAVVRGRPEATGGYAISLRLRSPTATTLRVTRTKGASLPLLATVSPTSASGRVVFEVESFDPLTSWHFAYTRTARVAGGRADAVIAPTDGRWRVRAQYIGTLSSSPSVSAWTEIAAH